MRSLLSEWYDDMTLVIVGHDDNDNYDDNNAENDDNDDGNDGTYSSETPMHEVILIAEKLQDKRKLTDSLPRIKFVRLEHMPSSRMEAMTVARAIRSMEPIRLEDGVGATSLTVGGRNNVVGQAVSCPVEKDMPWICKRVSNVDFLRFAYNLSRGRIQVQNAGEHGGLRVANRSWATVPIAVLGTIGDMGRHCLDITGTKHDGTPQGPFTRSKQTTGSHYPCLWNNNSKSQRSMIVEHDGALEIKHDATSEHVDTVWGTASRVHLNCQARYTAQRIIAAYTKDVSIGGRSWPNVIGIEPAYEKALATWCNSTFGIVLYWFAAGSQQLGRGMMAINAFRNAFPVLNAKKLSKAQINRFDRLFDNVGTSKMLPLNNPGADHVRRTIDAEILRILKIDIDMEQLYEWIRLEPQFDFNG